MNDRNDWSDMTPISSSFPTKWRVFFGGEFGAFECVQLEEFVGCAAGGLGDAA